ncbi:4'-phosphopantetheinyl transferase superfamily protein [Streptomyces sp. NPDC047968]|uniref:4'-phosphopantetheinyl transferase family protein n=1 Tax=unclassified Streptomyces TaxID=2593676 RepID=UPI003441BC39
MRYEELAGHPGVFHAPVAGNAAAARAMAGVLDAQETRRAEGFRRARDAERHRVAHVLLRLVLGAHLGEAPERLVFRRRACPGCGGPHGKPYLDGHPVHFSLSHTAGHVLLALACAPVGVDVEAVPGAATAREVLPALHLREREELTGLADAELAARLARCWARKEAALKATGLALTEGAEEPYVGSAGRPAQVPGLVLTDLPAPGGHRAALAVAEPVGRRGP